jgi:hypothetical protein
VRNQNKTIENNLIENKYLIRNNFYALLNGAKTREKNLRNFSNEKII